MGIYKMNHRLT